MTGLPETSALPTAAIRERIVQIQQSLPSSVRLIAITKKCPVEAIRIAYEVGVRDFGESQVQEALAKQAELEDLPDIVWHLIGHLQRNKVRKAVENFDWIHSVDSMKLARRLNDLAAQADRSPKVCLQVKLRPDPNKYGFSVTELMEALPRLDQCSHLEILGLMTIPPYGLSESETRAVFTEAQNLAQTIDQQSWSHLQMQHLSMGMSNDYGLAISAGATFIRLGRILFGDRPI